jgi:hypothetical protein
VDENASLMQLKGLDSFHSSTLVSRDTVAQVNAPAVDAIPVNPELPDSVNQLVSAFVNAMDLGPGPIPDEAILRSRSSTVRDSLSIRTTITARDGAGSARIEANRWIATLQGTGTRNEEVATPTSKGTVQTLSIRGVKETDSEISSSELTKESCDVCG